MDGGPWVSAQAGAAPQWIQIDFDKPLPVRAISIYPDYGAPQKRWNKFSVEVREHSTWRELPLDGAWIMPASIHFQAAASVEAVRLTVTDAGGAPNVRVAEIEVLASVAPQHPVESQGGFESISLSQFDLSSGESIDLSQLRWRLRGGDDPGWAQPALRDEDWTPTQVGGGWLEPTNARPIVWYRVNFTLPGEWQGEPVALDLGYVGWRGEIHVNGARAGRFGPSPTTNPFSKIEVVRAVIFVPPEILRYGGANTLAVRCEIGEFGGLYKGPYRAVRLSEKLVPSVLIDAEWKVRGADAPLHYLSTREHLNNYRLGEPIKLKPLATPLIGEAPRLELSFDVRDARGRAVSSGTFEREPGRGRAQHFRPVRVPAERPGKYVARIVCRDAGRELSSAVLPFQIHDRLTSGAFRVAPELDKVPVPDSARTLDRDSIGHYGGNRFRQNGDSYILDYDLSQGNANGNLVNSTLVTSFLPGPLLFSHNYKDPPRRLLAAGDYMTQISSYRELEGRDGLWNFGFLGPEHGMMPETVQVENASWTGVQYSMDYLIEGRRSRMRFHENSLSPAVLADVEHSRAVLFSGMGRFGLGHPSRVSFADHGRVRNVELRDGAQIDLQDRSENWLLFYFSGAAGFDEFDAPYLVVTQKKARSLVITAAGIELDYGPQPAGRIWLMPLHGQRMANLHETQTWRDTLPDAVLSDIRFWSAALLAYPVSCRERYRVLGERNRVVIEEAFDYLDTTDQWGTPSIRIALVPPVVALSARYGFPISFASKIELANAVALQGPLAYVRGTRLCFAVDDALRLGNEARTIKIAATRNETAERFRSQLNRETERILDQFRLEQHPWSAKPLSEGGISAAQPGAAGPFMIELALALPYLDEPLRDRASRALRDEIDTYLMRPDRYLTMTNRSTTLPVGVYRLTPTRLGIDNMAWTSTQLYALWIYAHTTGDWSLVDKYGPSIRRLFNILPNTADWAFFTCWDVLNGVRLGNGIQEVAHALAGNAAYLRMAAHMKDTAERDYAAYLMTRQAVSLYAQFVGNRWARQEVPWLASAPWAEDAIHAEQTGAWRHTEPVEFRGYGVNAIQCRSLIPPTSFILTPVPEIMRFYHEYARDESRYYWTKIFPQLPWEHINLPPLQGLMVDIADEMLYTIDIPLEKVVEVAESESRRSKSWFVGNIPNFRAVIEAAGQREYRSLVWGVDRPPERR
jgi:hypothetical protein